MLLWLKLLLLPCWPRARHEGINCQYTMRLSTTPGSHNNTPLIINALILITIALGSTSMADARATGVSSTSSSSSSSSSGSSSSSSSSNTTTINGSSSDRNYDAILSNYAGVNAVAVVTGLPIGYNIQNYQHHHKLHATTQANIGNVSGPDGDNRGGGGIVNNYDAINTRSNSDATNEALRQHWQTSTPVPHTEGGFMPQTPTASGEFYKTTAILTFGRDNSAASDKIDDGLANANNINGESATRVWLTPQYDIDRNGGKGLFYRQLSGYGDLDGLQNYARTNQQTDEGHADKLEHYGDYYSAILKEDEEEQQQQQHQQQEKYKYVSYKNNHEQQQEPQGLQQQQTKQYVNEPNMLSIIMTETSNDNNIPANNKQEQQSTGNYQARNIGTQIMRNYLTKQIPPLDRTQEQHKLKAFYNALAAAAASNRLNNNSNNNSNKQKSKRNEIVDHDYYHEDVYADNHHHYHHPSTSAHLDALTQIQQFHHLQEQINHQQHKFAQLQQQLHAHNHYLHHPPPQAHQHTVLTQLPPVTQVVHHNAHSLQALAGRPLTKHTQIVKNIPVPQHHQVHVPYKETVSIEIPETVITAESKPVPIEVPVTKTVAVPIVEEVTIPIERVKPVPVEKPIPYIVEKRVPYTVEKQIAKPIYYNVPVKVPIIHTVVHKDYLTHVNPHPHSLPLRVHRHNSYIRGGHHHF
ncbi:hypothetical protein GQX74_014974 [Glossina fuscipes]|nr:hypothetical protein GQX74_014974 [Glossina fuscipes]